MPKHVISRGLDIPIAGVPDQRVEPGPAMPRVAILGADHIGLKPALLVQPGDAVRRGQALLEDKKTPGVRLTAPATGTLAAVNRGDKRAFVSLVIDVAADDGPATQVDFAAWEGKPPATAEALRALLVESGAWAAFRTRPFSRVPAPQAVPAAIFVTAMDTRPNAPDVNIALAGREDDYAAGLLALRLLTEGPVHVCRAPGAALAVPTADRVRVEEFAGPHPAGLAGTHIHFLDPVGHHKTVWHVGAQDVAAIGRLVTTGKLDVERVVALGGPGIARPRLLRTRAGACLATLTAGELLPGEQRVVSGSVLDGRTAQGEAEGYLGRYHQQVSVLPEGRHRELFGWIDLGTRKFSAARVVLGALSRTRRLALTTHVNGGSRAMVPMGTHESVMPLDILATYLLRALLSKDVERAEALGALELDEEDLALCTYADPGKIDYGPHLRDMLAHLEKEA